MNKMYSVDKDGERFADDLADFKPVRMCNLERLHVPDNADNAYSGYFNQAKDPFSQQMAASVAHEVRNPLQSARALMQMMMLKYADDEVLQDTAQNIIAQLDFSGKVLTSFLNLSDPDYEAKSFCSPAAIVHEVFLMMRGVAFLHNIVLEEDYQYEGKTYCNDMAVRQILINLIRNALEAGTKDNIVRLTVFWRGKSICVSVSDTGEGMDAADLSNVFKAFVTSKHHGSGLGLTICCRLCRVINCNLEVETVKGGGTIFSLIIPLRGEPDYK